METQLIILYTIIGTFAGAIMSLIPALHAYNLAGLIIIICTGGGIASTFVPMTYLPFFMMAMIVNWAILNTIPALFLGAPDESAIFIVLPGQKYMMQGRGYEGAVVTGLGSVAGIIGLLIFSPIFFRTLPKLRQLTTPHMFWILGLVICYMLMSEWPKGSGRPKTGWGRFLDGWKNLFAGLFTFFIAGMLGFIILNKPLMPVEYAFQNIMPIFVGLYAIPWVIGNIFSKTEIPPQFIGKSVDFDHRFWARAGLSGFIGGMFAAFMPLVTGGIGGFMAGHATAQRDDRLFIASQGASKAVYYIGAFLLLSMPGLGLTRGGMAWMMRPFFYADSYDSYWRMMGVILLSAGLAFILLMLLSRLMIKIVNKINYRSLSVVTFFILIAVVLFIGGPMGLALMTVGTGIGLVPVYYHSRRMNCMGVLLVPITINMAGYGPDVLRLLGLA